MKEGKKAKSMRLTLAFHFKDRELKLGSYQRSCRSCGYFKKGHCSKWVGYAHPLWVCIKFTHPHNGKKLTPSKKNKIAVDKENMLSPQTQRLIASHLEEIRSITKIHVPMEYKSSGFYKSRAWRELRVDALKKYGRECCLCGATSGNGVVLHVDHIKPRSKYPELELELSNLQILCEDCNLGKSNRYEEKWRD